MVGIKDKMDHLKEILSSERFFFVEMQDDIKNALNSILKYKPDLVILNIDNLRNPFELINEVVNYLGQKTHIIIISKSKENAYLAIKSKVFDYILDPIDELEFRKSLIIFKSNFENEIKEDFNLCLKSYNDFHYINLNDILYLQADNNTTDFYTLNNKVTSFNTLKKFEKTLPSNFKRIHKSYLVNSNYVTRVNFGQSMCQVKNVKKMLPFSKTYLENMRAIKENLHLNSTVELN